jgi:transcriptional regulator with XRE-family HTH domain
MARSLDEILSELPQDRRASIDARYERLRQDVESLRQLRRLAGKAQSEIATALKIKQPSVSKIEKQTDMYLSTLRSYVEAIGGELELVVKLPKRPALRLHHLGEALGEPTQEPTTRRPRRRTASSR